MTTDLSTISMTQGASSWRPSFVSLPAVTLSGASRPFAAVAVAVEAGTTGFTTGNTKRHNPCNDAHSHRARST